MIKSLLRKSRKPREVEADGRHYLAAQYADELPDIQLLQQTIALAFDLRTAFVFVRGRYYPPAGITRLFQWLTCYMGKLGTGADAEACETNLRPGSPFAYPTVAGNYHLPCHLLYSFASHRVDGNLPVSIEDQFHQRAALDGLDRCPRYQACKLARIA